MKIYANEYCFEDGSSSFQFFQDKDERNFHFENYSGPDLIRRHDFEEVDLDEE